MNDHLCGRVPFVLAFFLGLSFAPAAYSQAALDFGDAPDYDGYATTLSENGARHAILPGFYLGLRVDAEKDGQPSPVADGDDLAGAYNDEDGVRFLSRLAPGAEATVAVIASQPGFVSGCIDFEANKTWAEAGNRIFGAAAVTAGTNFITFLVPAGAVLGPTYARFLFSKQAVETSNGPASDGEVEDHALQILQAAPTADIVITNIQHSAVHGTAEVMWTAEPGVMYQVQGTTNLPPYLAPSWADVGGLVLGPVNSQQDTNALQPKGFYRVVAPWVEGL